MNHRADLGSCIGALDDEFADPSGEVECFVIFALPSKALNSVYVSAVIAPACASAINSKAVSSEIFHDESLIR